MAKISIRMQQKSDAARFFEILNQPELRSFGVRPKTITDEETWLKDVAENSLKNISHDYSILLDGKVIGAVGLNVDQRRKYIAEIGYFVDKNHWGRGIATEAVKLIEKIGFDKLGIIRIEIRMSPKNPASEKVAIKAGYNKEGYLAKSHKDYLGKFRDSLLYAKVKKV